MLTNMNLSQSRDAEEKEKGEIINFLFEGTLNMMTAMLSIKLLKSTPSMEIKESTFTHSQVVPNRCLFFC